MIIFTSDVPDRTYGLVLPSCADAWLMAGTFSFAWFISCQMMLVTSSSRYRPVIYSADSATLVGRDHSERRSLPFRGQKR